MDQEQAKIKIEEILKKMNCTEITFPEIKDNLIIVTFNCKEITSFVADIQGWIYSGIYLDPSKEHQYRIDFKIL